MSLLDYQFSLNEKKSQTGKIETEIKVKDKDGVEQPWEISTYNPSQEEKDVVKMVLSNYAMGYNMQWKPRHEFNDISMLQRATIDKMAFNNYLPNDGDSTTGDITTDWRSNASTPVVRNKCISIAAHSLSYLLYPNVFCWDENSSEEDKEAGIVYEDLMEWSCEYSEMGSNYEETMLKAIMTAMWSPISCIYTGYFETYRNVKVENEDGSYTITKVLDPDRSGFKDEMVPFDQLIVANAFENDIQKQPWVIRRRTMSHDATVIKWGNEKNFEHVRRGMVSLFNDANQLFYLVYDNEIRADLAEVVEYWNKDQDLYLVMINGILIGRSDNANPRKDKLYPFAVTGYEMFDEGNFFWYSSLVKKIAQDAKIINTLYQIIIDSDTMKLLPSVVQIGGEAIGADIMIPSSVHTISDPNAKVQTVSGQFNDTNSGMQAIQMAKSSLDETSIDPSKQGVASDKTGTATEASILNQDQLTILNLFLKMEIKLIKQYSRLRLGDINQYMTIAQVSELEGTELTYKSFLLPNKNNKGKKIEFDESLPDTMTAEDYENRSGELLQHEFDKKKMGYDMELWKVNPSTFRKRKYLTVIRPEMMVKNKSYQIQKNLELFDRAIQLETVDQNAIIKDLLFASYDITKKNPDKYMKKEANVGMMDNPAQTLKQTVPTPTNPNTLNQQLSQNINQ